MSMAGKFCQYCLMEKSQRRQTIGTAWQKHMECERESGNGNGVQDRNTTEALNQCINQLLVDVSLCRQKTEGKDNPLCIR